MDKKLNVTKLEIKDIKLIDEGLVVNSDYLYRGGIISLSKHVESASHPGTGGSIHVTRSVPLSVLTKIRD